MSAFVATASYLMVKRDAKYRQRMAMGSMDLECTFRPSLNPTSLGLAHKHNGDQSAPAFVRHARAACGWGERGGACTHLRTVVFPLHALGASPALPLRVTTTDHV